MRSSFVHIHIEEREMGTGKWGHSTLLHFKHLQHLVAVMVDDLHGDLAGFGLGERPALCAVETAPGGLDSVIATRSDLIR